MTAKNVVTLMLLGACLMATGCAPRSDASKSPARQLASPLDPSSCTLPLTKRPFKPYAGTQWIGSGISYGAHRDGQHPGGPGPTREELREDLHILARHWSSLRTYAIGAETESILQIIRADKLPLKVMLGAWISAESRLGEGGVILEEYPDACPVNHQQVDEAVRLASAYPELVLAITIGNETQVFWSAHKVPTQTLIQYIRDARARTTVPVTTADDFNFWNKPESKIVAREVDFIVTHVYAMWAGQPLERALPFTQEKYDEVAQLHPEHIIVLGEAGWATQMHSEGEQAKLIKGVAGEDEQKTFYDAFRAWATSAKIATFYFEAFDESWKGGAHPDEVEKHWGLYHADRTPKKALLGITGEK